MNRELQLIGIVVAIGGTILAVAFENSAFIVVALFGTLIFAAGRIGSIKP